MFKKVPNMVVAMCAIQGLATGLRAQTCTPQWLPGDGIPGVDGLARAVVCWDPDGPSPRDPLIVVGGDFEVAGDVLAHHIAAWDPTQQRWLPLGTGMNGSVGSLLVTTSGDLIAGGGFTVAGGLPAAHIARWNGSSWSALGSGVVTTASAAWVESLAQLHDGSIVAAGSAYQPLGYGGFISRWDGQSWSNLGGDIDSFVKAISVHPDGSLFAGGGFEHIGGVLANNIARWDGASWSPLGEGTQGIVFALRSLDNGDLWVGGDLGEAGGVAVSCLARWDGSSWHAIPGAVQAPYGSSPTVYSITPLPNGEMLVGGDALALGTLQSIGLAQFDGTRWTDVAAGENAAVLSAAIAPDQSLYIAGGSFGVRGSSMSLGVARREPGGWAALGRGSIGSINALAALTDGATVVGGSFLRLGDLGDLGETSIAMRDYGKWKPVGQGLRGTVNAILASSRDDIIAGGSYLSINSSGGASIARWDGAAWSGLGTLQGRVNAITRSPNGHLFAGGLFSHDGGVTLNNIAEWNGTAWEPLAQGVTGPYLTGVNAAVSRADGDLIVGGSFTSASGVNAPYLARWDGTRWSALGGGVDGRVTAIVELINGDLVVGGQFFMAGGIAANHVARWDGQRWFPMGAGTEFFPLSFAHLSDGSLVAAGVTAIQNQTFFGHVARWNGTEWVSLFEGERARAYAIAARHDGTLWLGGEFTNVAGQVASALTRFACPCYANCDESDVAPVLALRDFNCFLDRFRSGDPYANCDGSTGSPLLSAADFVCFLNAFRAGCP